MVALLLTSPGCGGPQVKSEPVPVTQSQNLASQGSSWYQRGCYERAGTSFSQALTAARLIDDLEAMVRARNNLGVVALAQGRLDAAALHLERAQQLNRTAKSAPQASLIMGNLATLAFKAGRKPEAGELWQQAVVLAEQDPAHTGMILHLTNLAMLRIRQGRLDLAGEVLGRARREVRRKGMEREPAGLQLQMGLLHRARGDLAGAASLLQKALEMDRHAANSAGIAQTLMQLGRVQQELGQWKQAALTLDRSIRLYSVLGRQKKAAQVFELLKTNQEKSGRPADMEPYQRQVEAAGKGPSPVICR
jgi:tetratricopeptide (TPR) repeat protein